MADKQKTPTAGWTKSADGADKAPKVEPPVKDTIKDEPAPATVPTAPEDGATADAPAPSETEAPAEQKDAPDAENGDEGVVEEVPAAPGEEDGVSAADRKLRAERQTVYDRQRAEREEEDALMASIRKKLSKAEMEFLTNKLSPKTRKRMSDGAKQALSRRLGYRG